MTNPQLVLLSILLTVRVARPAHGTHLGKMRLESQKPTQVPINSTFHFGASTRMYTLRERPQTAPKPVMEELERMTTEDGDGALLGLPETETELDVSI